MKEERGKEAGLHGKGAHGAWPGLAALGLAVVLAGCRSANVRPADVIVEDAHSGGSVVALSPDGRRLASGGWEGRIRVYGLPEGAVVRQWQAHGDSVNGLVFIAGGTRLVSAGYDGRIVEWRLDGTIRHSLSVERPILDLALDEAADRIVTGHDDGSVQIRRLSDWTLLERRRGHEAAVRAVALHGATGRVAASGTDGAVILWDPDGRMRRLPDPPTDAWSLLFSADGSALFGGGWFDLYRWRVEDGTLAVLDTDHYGIIRSLDLAPDGRTLASISRQTDSAVYFLDPDTGATLARFQRHDLCGADVAISGDGRFMATTSDDASVRIWRLAP